jgi:hypothetical protein
MRERPGRLSLQDEVSEAGRLGAVRAAGGQSHEVDAGGGQGRGVRPAVPEHGGPAGRAVQSPGRRGDDPSGDTEDLNGYLGRGGESEADLRAPDWVSGGGGAGEREQTAPARGGDPSCEGDVVHSTEARVVEPVPDLRVDGRRGGRAPTVALRLHRIGRAVPDVPRVRGPEDVAAVVGSGAVAQIAQGKLAAAGVAPAMVSAPALAYIQTPLIRALRAVPAAFDPKRLPGTRLFTASAP